MLKLVLTSIALLATPVLAQQAEEKEPEKKTAKPKPKAAPVQPGNIVIELPQLQRRPQVVPLGGWRFEPQPRARVEGIVGGLRVIQPANPKFSTEAHFPAFIDEQITKLKSKFKLDEKTTRRLRVAAKGVVHRRKTNQPAKKVTDEPVIFGGGNVIWLGDVVQRRDMSAEFQRRLHVSKIWTKTLKRVLSEKQLKEWNQLNATQQVKRRVIAPNQRPPAIPVLNLPDR